MEVLVDREITGAGEAFAAFGKVRLFEGRSLSAADLGRAEILLVRSVTRVNAALLEGSAVRFVGSATAGVDHIDRDWLAANGVTFVDAAGCNARAVAEHVICCVYAFARERACEMHDLRVAIVGYGHVGRALGALLRALRIAFVINDPPLGAALDDARQVALAEALACDVVTVHVPLTAAGAYPTRQLIDRDAIAALHPAALLINAARGGVVDETALLERLHGAQPLRIALDCWENEPHIDAALAAQAWRATPHIAGHTREARYAASASLHQGLCRYLGVTATMPDLLPSNTTAPAPNADLSLDALLDLSQPLQAHTRRMRELSALERSARGARFDHIRREHGLRREFASFSVARKALPTDTVAQLQALGFTLV